MNRRNTKQRQLIAEAVRGLDHPTAEEVYCAVTQRAANIGKATVYRNLNLLSEQNEIAKICTGEGADRFDVRTDRHPHMRCRACGKLFDAPMKPLPPVTELLGDTGGFMVEDQIIEFVGLCPDCYKKFLED